MGALIRAHDWDATALGAPAHWPEALKSSVRMALSTRHPIFIFWGEAHLCFYNDGYRASLGPEKHPAILGARARDAWPETWAIIGPQIEQAMRGEEPTWHENQLVPILRNGVLEEVYWTYGYAPIRDESAPTGVGGVLVICTETTRQVLAQRRRDGAAPDDDERRYRAIFEQSPAMLHVLDAAGVTVAVNPAFEQGFGVCAAALPRCGPLGVDARLPYAPDLVARTLAGEVTVHPPRRHVGGRRADPGDARWIETRGFPVRTPSGEVVEVVFMTLDVDEGVEASRRKDEFIATLAHELRNPLAPIRNVVDVLRLESRGRRRVADVAGVLQRQVGQMVGLIDDLLDIGRIGVGRIELRPEALDLCEVLRDAVAAVRSTCEDAGQSLDVRTPAGVLCVTADRVRLMQILANLLGNACKFTPAGGRIAVCAERAGAEAQVRVSDSGVGIAPQDAERVFEMFGQAEAHRGVRPPGLGIGLSLSRLLANLHGGRLELRSGGAGQGSEFVVSVPLADPRSEHTPADDTASVPAPSAPPASRPRILVVDDTEDAAISLAMLLEAHGFPVATAFDGPRALEALAASRFDVVLLDIGMPGMDGYAVARRIRADETLAAVRLIALTGWGQPTDREISARAGFDAHLVKPVSLESLLALLAG